MFRRRNAAYAWELEQLSQEVGEVTSSIETAQRMFADVASADAVMRRLADPVLRGATVLPVLRSTTMSEISDILPSSMRADVALVIIAEVPEDRSAYEVEVSLLQERATPPPSVAAGKSYIDGPSESVTVGMMLEWDGSAKVDNHGSMLISL